MEKTTHFFFFSQETHSFFCHKPQFSAVAAQSWQLRGTRRRVVFCAITSRGVSPGSGGGRVPLAAGSSTGDSWPQVGERAKPLGAPRHLGFYPVRFPNLRNAFHTFVVLVWASIGVGGQHEFRTTGS